MSQATLLVADDHPLFRAAIIGLLRERFAPFQTLEAPGAKAQFTIPAAAIDGSHDLMYYFEVINTEGSGWFYPNPAKETPYIVVKVEAPRATANGQ